MVAHKAKARFPPMNSVAFGSVLKCSLCKAEAVSWVHSQEEETVPGKSPLLFPVHAAQTKKVKHLFPPANDSLYRFLSLKPKWHLKTFLKN